MLACGTVIEAPIWSDVEPVFLRQYARCHGPGADASTAKKRKHVREAMGHLDMSRFPFKSHHADVLLRIEEALTRGKDEKITMPADAPGMADDADMASILAWVRSGGLGVGGAPAAFETAAPAHAPHGH
jgi:hypothetical protein